MPAFLAFMIGVAGDVPQLAQPTFVPSVDAEPDLSPVLNGAPADRRAAPVRMRDDETVRSLRPGVAGPGAAGTVTIERRIIVRIPTVQTVQPGDRPAVPSKLSAAGTPRPKSTCLMLASLKGAMVQAPARIVFVTAGPKRYVASLERGCRPADFQSGFYLSPPADGAICAGRDLLHARSGLKCTITALTRVRAGM